MLQRLTISNYAIIDHLIFEPDKGLNTITGETGAGKSIIMGALSLILGDRADTTVLADSSQKSIIEAAFEIKGNESFAQALAVNELDVENPCIIRREIAVSGKSRAFINDTPVTLQVLDKLVSQLVDLHRQFGYTRLDDDVYTSGVVDAMGQATGVFEQYSVLFRHHVTLTHQLADLREKRAQWQKESDYKQFLLDELVVASFRENEIEETELQLRQIKHAEKIKNTLSAVMQQLEEAENSVLNELRQAQKNLAGINDLLPSAAPLRDRLLSSWEEVKDIAAEVGALQSKIYADPELCEQLQQRLDVGYKLLKKHSLADTAALRVFQVHLEDELKATIDLNEAIDKLAAEENKVSLELSNVGGKLSSMRKKTLPVLNNKMMELLALVGMPNAQFRASAEPLSAPGKLGLERIEFLLDANKSGQFQTVKKTASGGEMSRIMLCLASLNAKVMRLPTLIFDEVDTGISGEAARQVAILLRQLSDRHQLICITHQPQVAARGNRHFYVYKEPTVGGQLKTRLRVLSGVDRVTAIARMIGGEKPSEAALHNAQELMEQ